MEWLCTALPAAGLMLIGRFNCRATGKTPHRLLESYRHG